MVKLLPNELFILIIIFLPGNFSSERRRCPVVGEVVTALFGLGWLFYDLLCHLSGWFVLMMNTLLSLTGESKERYFELDLFFMPLEIMHSSGV